MMTVFKGTATPAMMAQIELIAMMTASCAEA